MITVDFRRTGSEPVHLEIEEDKDPFDVLELLGKHFDGPLLEEREPGWLGVKAERSRSAK